MAYTSHYIRKKNNCHVDVYDVVVDFNINQEKIFMILGSEENLTSEDIIIKKELWISEWLSKFGEKKVIEA